MGWGNKIGDVRNSDEQKHFLKALVTQLVICEASHTYNMMVTSSNIAANCIVSLHQLYKRMSTGNTRMTLVCINVPSRG